MKTEWSELFNRHAVIINFEQEPNLTSTQVIDYAKAHDAIKDQGAAGRYVILRFAGELGAEEVRFAALSRRLAEAKQSFQRRQYE